MRLLVGLDIGTSRIKAVVYPVTMECMLYQTSCPTPVSHPGPGLSEHNPDALWQAVVSVLKDISEQGPEGSIVALSVSSMADTGVVLDEEDQPCYPIVAWYDQRCRQQVTWLSHQISASQFHSITGQRFSTSLGISKWLWLRENVPDLENQKITWLSVSDYIIYRLTNRKMTDYSTASRTGLFDQRTLHWSERLLKIVGLPESSLPFARPSSTPIGEITSEARAQTGFPPGTLCVLGGHDHLCAAAAVDAGCPTTLVDSCGTAQSLLVGMETFKPDERMLRTGYVTYAHVIPNLYILRGGLRSAGGMITWLAKCLSNSTSDDPALPYNQLMVEATDGIGQRAGPLWLPHLLGSGTPYDDERSLAAVLGLRPEYNRGDIFRGLFESLAFWMRQNLEEIEVLIEHPITKILLLGGTTRLDLLTQLKADVLNRPMMLPQIREPSATGAALLAGVGAGYFGNLGDGISQMALETKVIQPDPGRVRWYSGLYEVGYQPLYTALRQINHDLVDLPVKMKS